MKEYENDLFHCLDVSVMFKVKQLQQCVKQTKLISSLFAIEFY